MKHSIKKDENTGNIHITINVNNSLNNTANSSAENTNANKATSESEPQSKPFITQLFEGAAIGAATAILSTFF